MSLERVGEVGGSSRSDTDGPDPSAIVSCDHDQIKGNKLTFFCVDELFSNSELLCSVDFCHYDAMLEAQNIVKGFQIHPF